MATQLVGEFGHEGTFRPAEQPDEFVALLERPRKMIIMVKAGGPTDAVIDEFAPLLEPGDMIACVRGIEHTLQSDHELVYFQFSSVLRGDERPGHLTR